MARKISINLNVSFTVKPGKCPKDRLECPHKYSFGGPEICYSDQDCSGRQKCCNDACLSHKTCKSPEYN